jgi:hypothetical protein
MIRGHNRGFFKCLGKLLSKNYVVLIDCDQWVQQCPSFMRKKSKLLRWRRYNLQQLSAWTRPDFCSCLWKDAWFHSWCYFTFADLFQFPSLDTYSRIQLDYWNPCIGMREIRVGFLKFQNLVLFESLYIGGRVENLSCTGSGQLNVLRR